MISQYQFHVAERYFPEYIFVKMWSVKVEVLQIILVGQPINWLSPYVTQNYLYLLISGNKSLSIL